MLHKLFHKDAVIAHDASSMFRFTPYIQFSCMWLAVGIVPVLATDLPLAPAADVIALVGLFALARVFAALAAMDIGTAFGRLGARREMLIGCLAEPAMLMVFFNLSLIAQSTSLNTIVETLAHARLRDLPEPGLRRRSPFCMVALAENARIPVDNPTTHLELTMIHEAMILEYSARHLALIEWAVAVKLIAYSASASRCSCHGASPKPATGAGCRWPCARAVPEADGSRRRSGSARDLVRQDADFPRAGVPRHRPSCCRCSAC